LQKYSEMRLAANQTDYRNRHVHIYANRRAFHVALAIQRIQGAAAIQEATAHRFWDSVEDENAKVGNSDATQQELEHLYVAGLSKFDNFADKDFFLAFQQRR
jgi:hypothetical protein